ncbi:hypothetical protein DPMN_147405 [Dreissena polymorpha]|uniref:Uncharacterized protein n=1 Tax=Dreissena polymorpha TaxID=45954 RepID=A0A9D4J3C4_DREPO|nr:hypothetical protein DPMN_147405 [Dreissena polymorpha]
MEGSQSTNFKAIELLGRPWQILTIVELEPSASRSIDERPGHVAMKTAMRPLYYIWFC